MYKARALVLRQGIITCVSFGIRAAVIYYCTYMYVHAVHVSISLWLVFHQDQCHLFVGVEHVLVNLYVQYFDLMLLTIHYA